MKLFAFTTLAVSQATDPLDELFEVGDTGGEHVNKINGIDYHIFRRYKVDWNEADAACKAKGMHLVEFQNQKQYDDLWTWIRTLEGSGIVGKDLLGQAYWIGYRENRNRDIVSGMNIDSPWTDWSGDEPNDTTCKDGKSENCEKCIRMRRFTEDNGKAYDGMNDAQCGFNWAGAAKNDVHMSYICQSAFDDVEYGPSPLCPSEYTGPSQPDSGCYVQNVQWNGTGEQDIQCNMLNKKCLAVSCTATGLKANLRADLFHTHQLNLATIQQQLIAGGTAVDPNNTGRDLLVNGQRVPYVDDAGPDADLYFTVEDEFVAVHWNYASTAVSSSATLARSEDCPGEGDNAINYTIKISAPGNNAENHQEIEFYVDTTVDASCQYCTEIDVEESNFWVNQEDVSALKNEVGSFKNLFSCKLYHDEARQEDDQLTETNIVNMGETIYGEVTSTTNLPGVRYRLIEYTVTDGGNAANTYKVIDNNVAQTDVLASKADDANTGESLYFQYLSFGFQGNSNQNVLDNQCKIELYLAQP